MGLSQGKAATHLAQGKAVTLPFDYILMAAGMIPVFCVSQPCSLCCVPGRRSTWTVKSTSKYFNTILGWAVTQNSPRIHFLSLVFSFWTHWNFSPQRCYPDSLYISPIFLPQAYSWSCPQQRSTLLHIQLLIFFLCVQIIFRIVQQILCYTLLWNSTKSVSLWFLKAMLHSPFGNWWEACVTDEELLLYVLMA